MNKNKIVWIILWTFAVIFAIIPMIMSIVNGLISCDSAYYLCMVEHLGQGKILYKDLHCGYTPLWFYMMVGLKYLLCLPSGCYEFYLVFHYIIQIACAFFIYKIIRLFAINNKSIAFFSAWLFIMITHWMDGNIVLLEMPSIMFGLFGIWLTLLYKDKSNWIYIFIGLLSAASFLCKQFGFGFLFLSLYLILFMAQNKWQKVGYFLFGYFLPIVICYIIWNDLFFSIVFSGYGTTTAAEAGLTVSLLYKIDCILGNYYELFTRIAVVLPISLCFIVPFIKQNRIVEYLFCWCGIIGFMLQFYFVEGGLHYKLYVIPFVVIIVALSLSLTFIHKWIKSIIYIPMILMTCYSIYADYNNRIRKIYMHPELKESQYKLAEQVSSIVKPRETLWVANSGIFYVYYLSNICPPNISTIGYSFGPLGISEVEASKQIDYADYVLSFTKDYASDSFYTHELKKRVWKHKCIYLSDEVVIHNMSKLE